MNDYLPVGAGRGDLDEYIVAPGLGEQAGLVGAMVLATMPGFRPKGGGLRLAGVALSKTTSG
jgi:hypothetical protein